MEVSNFGGGRCRTCRQHPLGAHHRRHQLRCRTCRTCRQHPPRGPAIDVSLNMVPTARIFPATPTRGATVVNSTATKKIGSLRC
jgi:hypothetical protein